MLRVCCGQERVFGGCMLDEEQNPLVRVHGLCFRLRDAEHLVVEALPRLSLALGKEGSGNPGAGPPGRK